LGKKDCHVSRPQSYPTSTSTTTTIATSQLTQSCAPPPPPPPPPSSSFQRIDTFIKERILLSAQQIAKLASDKISDGDVVLVYGRSYSVELALCQAATEQKKKFRVVVVDARPLLEGKRLLKALACTGIAVTYVDLSAIAYIMRTVNKVLLGAAALLSNGAVISRAGTALGEWNGRKRERSSSNSNAAPQ